MQPLALHSKGATVGLSASAMSFAMRRNLLKATALGGASWLAGVAQLLARDDRQPSKREPAQSLILIWLAGGASQLETFDPHPGAKIAGDTTAIKSSLEGVQLASGYEHLADCMHRVSLVRNMVSKEGDH